MNAKIVSFKYISTNKIAANRLIKLLDKIKFERFINLLSIKGISNI